MKYFLIILSLISGLAHAAPDNKVPSAMLKQVEHLVELLRDSYATGYPEATMYQLVHVNKDTDIALSVFTIEGFGGGNNHQQFLAVFYPEKEQGKQHFVFGDVIQIGGKGWRSIQSLQAKASQLNHQQILISLPALENGPDDGANFPSVKTKVSLTLKDGKLSENRPK
jgi:hypothetical protein